VPKTGGRGSIVKTNPLEKCGKEKEAFSRGASPLKTTCKGREITLLRKSENFSDRPRINEEKGGRASPARSNTL